MLSFFVWLIGAVINFSLLYFFFHDEEEGNSKEFFGRLAIFTILWPVMDVLSIGFIVSAWIIAYLVNHTK